MTLSMTVMTLILTMLSLPAAALAQANVAHQQSKPAEPSEPDVVVEWNAIIMDAAATTNGVEQVRLASIAHLAVFEAVNAIARRFEPYLGTISAPPGAVAEAAAIAAAHRVLWTYLDQQRDALDTLREASLGKLPGGPGKETGIAVGEAAAQAMIANRVDDGSSPPEFYVPISTEPGQWQLTETCPAEGGPFLHVRNMKPFGIERGDQFRSEPPPELTSSLFARHFDQVRTLGGAGSSERSERQATVARFYAAVLSQAVWNPVARQVGAAERTSLVENARMFALVNMAMADALVAVFDTKYHYTFWRPVTAIHTGVPGRRRTEPDQGFAPFLPTPCHPSYPSAHASSSYAAREVLDEIFGNTRYGVSLSTPALPGVELRYERLEHITKDIDLARIAGGMHYRFDQQAGAVQGRHVGRYIARHHLRPLDDNGGHKNGDAGRLPRSFNPLQ